MTIWACVIVASLASVAALEIKARRAKREEQARLFRLWQRGRV